MKAEQKIMYKRLEALKLAEELGNITKVCRERGISRSQFYEYKRRFQEQGFEGLRDLPPIHQSHPFTTSKEIVKRLLELSAQYPAKGCGYLEILLKREGKTCSKPTIQKILDKHGLGSKYQRLLKLESENLAGQIELNREEELMLEKNNPCFRERHIESSKPGELLCQDTTMIARLAGMGKIYVQAVVDAYCSLGFAYVHTGKIPAHAAAVLHNEVLPFYCAQDLDVENILTDNGTEYCGTEGHTYELYLDLNDIQHRRTKPHSPQTNGFVERFNKTLKEEFFDIAFRQKSYEDLETLQQDLNEWLCFYNGERVHLGYRNMGKTPMQRIMEYKQSLL